jgi:hypothetical protein
MNYFTMVLEASVAHSSEHQTPIVAKAPAEVDDTAEGTTTGALGGSEVTVRTTHALVDG